MPSPMLMNRDLTPALRAVATKVGTAPVVASCWLVATRIALSALGVDGYALFAIIVGIAVLLPFADLGLGAAVMDAAARKRADLDRVIATSWRVLVIVALSLVMVAGGLATTGKFAVIFGTEADVTTELAGLLAVSLYAVGLPVAIGGRLLAGLGRNDIAVLFQAASAIVMLLLVLGCWYLDGGLLWYATSPFMAAIFVNLGALLIGFRLAGLSLSKVVKSAFDIRIARVPVANVAAPMLVITLVLPLAYQLDRIILSHLSTTGEVAEYSVVYQVFAPLIAAVGAGALALWPVFVGARHAGELTWRRFGNVLAVFTAMGATISCGLLVVGRPVAAWVSDGEVVVGADVVVGFATLLFVQTVSYPMAMLLTDHSSLKIQAVLHVAMLTLNLPLTLLFALRWGASGPLFASVLAILLAMVLPQLILSHRMLSRSVARKHKFQKV